MRAGSLFVVVATMAVATSVSAQTAPPPAAYAAPVQPITQPPPPPPPLPPHLQAVPLYVYEQQSKSQFGALVLEWFLPGGGSLYAGNPGGAFKTWGMIVVGAALVLIGIDRGNDGHHDDVTTGLIYGGMGSLLAGRIFGLVDAWTVVGEHNDGLRANLGL
jgi:hypothetical protein